MISETRYSHCYILLADSQAFAHGFECPLLMLDGSSKRIGPDMSPMSHFCDSKRTLNARHAFCVCHLLLAGGFGLRLHLLELAVQLVDC